MVRFALLQGPYQRKRVAGLPDSSHAVGATLILHQRSKRADIDNKRSCSGGR